MFDYRRVQYMILQADHGIHGSLQEIRDMSRLRNRSKYCVKALSNVVYEYLLEAPALPLIECEPRLKLHIFK